MSSYRGKSPSIGRQGQSQKGGVLALVALFLPIALISTGVVVDLGIVFCSRKAVQAACDLGALAGVQALDWDRLAEGIAVIDETLGEATAIEVATENLASYRALFSEVTIWATVKNPPSSADPCIAVEASFRPATFFFTWLPGLSEGLTMTWLSEAAVVERTEW